MRLWFVHVARFQKPRTILGRCYLVFGKLMTFFFRLQTGGLDSLVNVWHLNVESLENVYQLNNNELHSTMHGHTAAVTCLAIASNGLFAVSGSEDKLVLVWGLTVGSAVFTFSVSSRVKGETEGGIKGVELS